MDLETISYIIIISSLIIGYSTTVGYYFYYLDKELQKINSKKDFKFHIGNLL